MLMDTDQYKVLKGLFYLKKKASSWPWSSLSRFKLSYIYIYSVTYLEYKSACQVIYAVAYLLVIIRDLANCFIIDR